VLFSCRPTPMARHLEDGLRIASRMLGAAQYISMERFDGKILREQINLLLPSVELPLAVEESVFLDQGRND
ncbi:MAG: hypothetical protein JSS86_07530, partial [Cyanobacteria bacterium SZAS LIN-2]|nr:hypothetical protein [Cyanobacteria bacterium SZAS LIN-2]